VRFGKEISNIFMRNIFGLSILLLAGVGFSGFQIAAEMPLPPFSGIWQGVSEEESSIIIEFSPEGYYRLSVGGNELTENIESWGEVRYEWGQHDERYLITIFGEQEPELTTQLEAVLTGEGFLELQVFSEKGKHISSILLKKV
jgi:hypothetical protein